LRSLRLAAPPLYASRLEVAGPTAATRLPLPLPWPKLSHNNDNIRTLT
jgi:hypothetical protein